MTDKKTPSDNDENTQAPTPDVGLFGSMLPPAAQPPRTEATKQGKIIDVLPDECCVWAHNPRILTRLSEASTLKLRESLIASGGQLIPVVGRPSKVSTHKYEILAGARRHWSVDWLIRNGFPDMRLKLEVRDLTDEEAFQLCAAENQDREGVSDYETAVELERALEVYYHGSQVEMSRALGKSESWVSRHLLLADVPTEVVDSYPDWSDLGVTHAPTLVQKLKEDSEAVLDRAKTLTEIHGNRKIAGTPRMSAAECLEYLVSGEKEPGAVKKKSKVLARFGPRANPHVEYVRNRKGRMVLTVTRSEKISDQTLIDAFTELLRSTERGGS